MIGEPCENCGTRVAVCQISDTRDGPLRASLREVAPLCAQSVAIRDEHTPARCSATRARQRQ